MSKVEISMELYKEDFSYGTFIKQLRNHFFSPDSEIHGESRARFLGAAVHKYVDVNIFFEEGKYVQVRLQTEDAYYICFKEGSDNVVEQTWFVMLDGINDRENVLVQEEKDNRWKQESLGFGSSYDQNGLGDFLDTEVSKETMITAMRALYKYDSSQKRKNKNVIKACRMIATVICEPLRYVCLQTRIHRAWKKQEAYKFKLDDKTIIKGWSKLSKCLGEREPTEVEYRQWVEDNDTEKLEKWSSVQKVKREWEKLRDDYGVQEFRLFCALLTKRNP